MSETPESLTATLAATLTQVQQWCPVRPSPRQLLALLDWRDAHLFGGAAGGGKSAALLMACTQFVDRPNFRALIVRETSTELTEAGALMDVSHQWWDETDAEWSEVRKRWTFPSGARVTFGHLAEQNYRRHLGTEWHLVCVDEATSCDPVAIGELRTRLRRTHGDTIPLRMRAASNPGGPSHDWWRTEFVDRGLLIQSLLEDNPGIDHAAYRRQLRASVTASRFAQLADGDWLSSAHIGASWDESDIVFAPSPEPSEIASTVIGVDPSAAGSDTSDECGVIVAHRLLDGRIHIAEDHSGQMRPGVWAPTVSHLSEQHAADVIIEANLAGMTDRPDLLAAAGRRVQPEHVTGSKQSRHVTLAIRCRSGEVVFDETLRGGGLVRQMRSWTPPQTARRRVRSSPDRVDALVMAARPTRAVGFAR